MNNLAVVTDDTPLQPGQIRFYCAAQPPLQAGGYWLQASQTVTGLKEQPANNSFGMQNPFAVDGARFRLPPQDLQLVYPPANQVGNYEEVLPHVVLRTRTLPWVRQIDGGTASAGDAKGGSPPWLALIMLYPDELQGAKPFTTTVERLIKPEAVNILGPSLIDADSMAQADKEQQLLALDVDIDVFLGISPQLEELPFLAHVREVNTDQKEIMAMVEDGWFSVVVGNRLPKTGSENTCFLVSLEGQQAHLNGGPPIDPMYTKIRLACLASWTFTAADARGSFLELMQDLAERGGIDLLRPSHEAFGDSLTVAQEQAKEALEIGFLPLQNLTRTGEITTSWYRGPLAPVPTTSDKLGPYFFSDRAIRYDQANGLFDMSYASAWQIGQLLALSDAAFAKSLFDWRMQSYQEQQAMVASEHVHGLARELNVTAAHAGPEKKAAHTAQNSLLPILQGVLGKLCPGQSATARAALVPGAAPPKIQAHAWRDAAQLAGVHDPALWQKALQQGRDPLNLLYQHLYPKSEEIGE